jgi:hypothetical protein
MPTKTNYWIWEPYSTVRGMAFVTELIGWDAEQDDWLFGGRRLAEIPRLSVRSMTPGRFYDLLGTYRAAALLVSPVLRRVLEETPRANLQFVPVSVRGKPELKYFLVNVIEVFPALDLDKSKYDTFPEGDAVSRIRKFVLRPMPEDAPPIFHVAEDPPLVMVKNDLRRRLAAVTKHPGVFTPAEKYRNEF